MARAPSALLRREDFPDLQGDRLDRFFRTLNQFFTDTRSAMVRQLTFTDNVLSSWKEITFTSDASGQIPSGTKFTHDLPGGAKPKAVTVERAATINTTTNTETQASVYGVPAWTESNGSVVISALGGLAASTKYRMLFLVKGG